MTEHKTALSNKELLDPTQTHKSYSFKAAFAIIFTLIPLTDALGQGRQGASEASPPLLNLQGSTDTAEEESLPQFGVQHSRTR